MVWYSNRDRSSVSESLLIPAASNASGEGAKSVTSFEFWSSVRMSGIRFNAACRAQKPDSKIDLLKPIAS